MKLADISISVELKKINLHLATPSYMPWTMKSEFVDFMKNPFRYISTPVEKQQVLNDISMKAKSGDRIGILGRNGAGKTSLCRVISGQLKPSQGQMTVKGQVTAIFDTAIGIYPDLTGRENAELVLKYLLPKNSDTHKRVIADAGEFSELKSWLDRPFRMYSAGMKTRLSLSLITAIPSEILILDEVFEGADEGFRKKIQLRLNSFIDRSSIFIFVSHSRQQILNVCNRAILVNQGRLLFDGSPQEAFQIYDSVLGL